MNIRTALPSELGTLLDLWLRSVRTTHTFLTEEDIQALHPLVRDHALPALELWVLEGEDGAILGWMGLDGAKLEALFLDPAHTGKGHGRRMVDHARSLKGPLTVDVNEQNPEALRFYEACGFRVVGRSELDGQGRPFPLLHLAERV
ncbi:MAG: acetyltransferase [Holophagaceae bacterium]|nr:acetyltransferase [Holophagaceae bacterium]